LRAPQPSSFQLFRFSAFQLLFKGLDLLQ
jgi:hypothetical protein